MIEKIRERLEKRIAENRKYISTNFRDVNNQIIGLKKAIDIVNQVEAEYNNGWIPCSERLPKYDEYVLCQGKNSQFIACIDSLDNKWRDNGFRVRINITHWQPLPQPPKGE